ncbi:MAG: hypothetical protein U0Q16_29175 [Bryobacteraceae bacterium]
MTHAEIRLTIETNLGTAPSDIRLQPDPFQGWRLAVVSPAFEGKSQLQRRDLALRSLDSQHFEWVDLLTPAEQEWAGVLPVDSSLEDIPTWSEALGRANSKQTFDTVFPSSLEVDLPLPIVTTFYSLRGGVGRSSALAYTARVLASRGRRVVCVDLDLEAPGLASLFGVEEQITPEQGVVYLLTALDRQQTPDFSKHLIRVVESEELYCVPAGRPSADYARLLAMIDPSAWYREERNPLHGLIDGISHNLPFVPDAVLLDARTGINPLSGPPLFDLADLAVIVFFPHPQSRAGTGELVRALRAAHTRRVLDSKRLAPEPRFLVSPVPASRAAEVTRRYRDRSLEWIHGWMNGRVEEEASNGGALESEVVHFVPYRESLATSDHILSDQAAWDDYRPIADWIERFVPAKSERELQSLSASKQEILRELRFSQGTAEKQDDLVQSFVETDRVRMALDLEVPLVRGRKGTGKTAVFRYLTEAPEAHPVVVVTAPPDLRKDMSWMLTNEGFRDVEQQVKQQGGWPQFWRFYICLACQRQGVTAGSSGEITEILGSQSGSQRDTIERLDRLFTLPRGWLLAHEWLLAADASLAKHTILLFDGLDTGFGSGEEDRVRRRSAVEGLFDFFTGLGKAITKLKFKILLREDIWRQLRFENKSHLHGRDVSLDWKDQSSFMRVVVKQAAISGSFRAQLGFAGLAQPASFDDWSDQQVRNGWNLLVGERMKGGKTSFTSNWVWNRLADANGDHSPRHLLQLFGAALTWEQKEEVRNSYDKSAIRPRALIEVLPQLSERALEALKEEYPELEPLFAELQGGRTPVPSESIKAKQTLPLGREVGLIGIHEGTEEEVERYRVPDLYRDALGMTRKGPA